MKQKIIKIANLLDIDIIGFTTVFDYSYLTNFLNERANKGYNVEFEEPIINKRLSVKNIFPDCKSIIAVGIPYAEGYEKPCTKDKGILSVSSFGEDYHKKLREILKSLANEINKYVDFNYEICVDTSPLIDREICKNARIGSYGKNSLLINEEYGSFINLGYLLTDIELESEKSMENINTCGDCKICIKSCPNNAILERGGVNAKKCISYLTQTKEYIPLEFRKNMGNQIYGCDVCQVVCPKNKINSEKKSKIDNQSLMVDIEELMNMSNKDFKLKYGHLAGSWRGKNIWKRNALIAIGNLGLINMFDLVKKELNNSSAMIKIYAAWSLIKLDKTKAIEILNNQIKIEDDKVKREYIKLLEG